MKLYKLFALAAVFGMTACYGIKDEDFPELSAITFSEVSDVIDVNIGEELVYTDLKVNSSLPVTYEWSYGQRKQTGTQQDMASRQTSGTPSTESGHISSASRLTTAKISSSSISH